MSSRESSVRIYYDVREERSGVPETLKKLGVIAIPKQLPEGDYVIPEDHVIERKSASDFVSSLFDGRLFDQAQRLVDTYEDVFYIIEGDFQRELKIWSNRRRQLIGALVTLVTDYNVRLFWSSDTYETAMIIERLARRLLEGHRGGAVVINKKPKSLKSIRDWQLYVLQSFPGIGLKTAERILERFGSIEAFVKAGVSELASVEGVGEAKAMKIKELLKSVYQKPGQRPSSVTLDSFAIRGEGNEGAKDSSRGGR